MTKNVTTSDKMVRCESRMVTPFFVSLFIECGRTFGTPLSAAVNHRWVTTGNLSRQSKNGLSMIEAVEAEDSDAFQDRAVSVFPYELSPLERKSGDTVKIISLGDFPYKEIGTSIESKPKRYMYVLDGVVAKTPSKKCYAATCVFLKSKPFIYQSGNRSHFYYNSFFEGDFFPSGTSNEELNKYCINKEFPFKVNFGKSVAWNNRRFRRYVQLHTTIRFAMIEGNHRMFCVCQRFYGRDVQDPLMRFSQQEDKRVPLLSCSLSKKIQVNVLSLLDCKSDQVLTKEDQKVLIAKSVSLQRNAESTVESSWNKVLTEAFESLSGSVIVENMRDLTHPLISKDGRDPMSTAMRCAGDVCKRFLSDDAQTENLFTLKDKKSVGDAILNHFNQYPANVFTSQTLSTFPRYDSINKNFKIPGLCDLPAYIFMWIVAQFGLHKEGVKSFRDFLQCQYPDVLDMRFLALYVVVPTNAVAEFMGDTVLAVLQEMNYTKTKLRTKGVFRQKLKHAYRYLICRDILEILFTFGLEPTYSNQPKVSDFLEDPRNMKMRKGPKAGTPSSRPTYEVDEFELSLNAQAEEAKDPRSINHFKGITQVVLYYWKRYLEHNNRFYDYIRRKVSDRVYTEKFLCEFSEKGTRMKYEFQSKERGENYTIFYDDDSPFRLDVKMFGEIVSGDINFSDFLTEEEVVSKTTASSGRQKTGSTSKKPMKPEGFLDEEAKTPAGEIDGEEINAVVETAASTSKSGGPSNRLSEKYNEENAVLFEREISRIKQVTGVLRTIIARGEQGLLDYAAWVEWIKINSHSTIIASLPKPYPKEYEELLNTWKELLPRGFMFMSSFGLALAYECRENLDDANNLSEIFQSNYTSIKDPALKYPIEVLNSEYEVTKESMQEANPQNVSDEGGK